MKLYLVRHAVAYEHGDPAFPNDDDRTLTPEGRKRFKKAATGMLELIDPPAVILTSPLPRAAQTAEILQEACGSGTHTSDCDALRPGGSFEEILAACAAQLGDAAPSAGSAVSERGIALVGHAPSIGLLAAFLLNGDSAGFALELEKGGAACIDFDGLPEAGYGNLDWLVTPRILRKLA